MNNKIFAGNKAAIERSFPFLLLILVGALLLAAVAGCSGEDPVPATPPAATGVTEKLATAEFQKPSDPGFESAVLYVEVARTGTQRARGLMERQSMAPDRGMVFVFDSPTRGAFWMKNTYIPLSIAFIDGQGTIVDIQDMEPLSEELHTPAADYVYAVEANQGYFADRGIAVGDRAAFEGL